MRIVLMVLVASLVASPTMAGPLLDRLRSEVPGLLVEGQQVDELGETEVYRDVVIGFAETERTARASELRLSEAGPDIQAVLNGAIVENEAGLARAASITVSRRFLQSLLAPESDGEPQGYAWLNGVELYTTPAGEPDRLFVERLSVDIVPGSTDAISVSTLLFQTHSGERLELGKVSSSGIAAPLLQAARAALDLPTADATAAATRFAVQLERLVVFDSGKKALLGIKALEMVSNPSAIPDLDPLKVAALSKRSAAIVSAVRALSVSGDYRFSMDGVFVPVEDLAPAAAGARLAEAGLERVAGRVEAETRISTTGEIVATLRVDTDQLAGLTLDVRGNLDLIDDSRVAEILDGSPLQLTDYPNLELSRLALGFQDRGANDFVAGMTGRTIPEAIRAEGRLHASQLPGGKVVIEEIIEPVAAWVDRAAQSGEAVYASTQIDQPVSMVELVGLAAISPKTLVDKLEFTSRKPNN